MTNRDPLDLEQRIAFVTGAGQGAGKAIAITFAAHNAGGVAVNDYVPERAEVVAAEIRSMGVPAMAVPADVGHYALVKQRMQEVEKQLGPVTILVNNAGNAGPNAAMGVSPLFWESDPEDWDRFFHTNLKGVMNCCHAALPYMVEQQAGRIVSIISDAGRVGEPRLAAYSAAKAGVAGFMRSLAREAGRFNITCNAISLSTLEPSLEEPARTEFLNSEKAKQHVARYAIRRFGRPDDVANMALYLCSNAASWITGQTYPVNGGYSFAQ